MSTPGTGDAIGPYRLEKVIGVGGMGLVHVATDTRLGRRVALKIMLGQHASSPEFSTRFQREAGVLARLDSPHVVAIYDHGEHEGHPYIAMQYAAGGDLGTLLSRRGSMPPALAAGVAAQVADALVAAHAVGVVHRDVKPANVLVRDDRFERLHVYLSDFGVALTEADGLTSPGAVVGTWNYLAPERVRGGSGSAASDVYSVGCLLHEMLTGRPPYDGSDVEVAMLHLSAPVPRLPGTDDTSQGLNRVLERALAKDPTDRYPSAIALRDDLRALAGRTPLPGAPAARPGVTATPGAGRARRRTVVGVVVGTVAVVAVAAGVALSVGRGDDPGGGGSSPSSAATTTPPDPTGSTSSPPPDPAPAVAVGGDLDSDGRADAVWTDYDRSYVARSTVFGFADVVRRPLPGRTVLAGDATGDGTGDLVRVDGEAPTLVVTVHAGGRDALAAAVLTVPRSTGATGALSTDPDYALADVDGDGDDDLVVATAGGTTTTTLTVALSSGDGAFGRPQRWYDGPLDPDDAGWAVGDLDGDGDDDLLHYASAPGEFSSRARAVVSSGSAAAGFAPAGQVLRTDEVPDGVYASIRELVLGDVDGDGEPELVGLESFGAEAVVWEWLGSRFGRARSWTAPAAESEDSVTSVALLDVDADGLADLVALGDDGLSVQLSSGAGFVRAPRWRSRFAATDAAVLVDRVSLGIF